MPWSYTGQQGDVAESSSLRCTAVFFIKIKQIHVSSSCNMCSPLVCSCCHASQHLESTVTLAWGFFISLCAGLFIVSQASCQMCTLFTVLLRPLGCHMSGFPSSSSPHMSYREQLPQNICPEWCGGGALLCKHRGWSPQGGSQRGQQPGPTSELLVYSTVMKYCSFF